jgi:phosphate transport system substrate-binding protein
MKPTWWSPRWVTILALFVSCRGQTAIRVDGSSTVYPITEAVAEEFQRAGHETPVTVGISGTGGGFKRFCAGETDISDASRPIKPSEVALCARNGIEYVEVPIAYDGIAVVINPKNTAVAEITTAELRIMWAPEAQGRVKRWNQVRPGWPDEELRLFGPGVDSGTYDYFTEAIVRQEHSSRGDFTSSEDDNVLVQGIAGDRGALGFFGISYYTANRRRLKLLPVDDGKPDNGRGAILPTVETIRDGTYQPLSRPLLLYLRKGALDRAEVAEFVRFYLRHAPELVVEAGYVPLPDLAYPHAQARVDAKKTGSTLGGQGSQVGLSIEALLAKEK